MNEWSIKIDGNFFYEFYSNSNFKGGMNRKRQINPFSEKFEFYDNESRKILVIKQTEKWMFWHNYKIDLNLMTENLNIDSLSMRSFSINGLEFIIKMGTQNAGRVLTFFFGSKEIGYICSSMSRSESYKCFFYELHNYNLYLLFIGAIFIYLISQML